MLPFPGRKCLTQKPVQIHNALVISLFDATATLKRPPTPPPPSMPKPPPAKRRRTLLPYQGPDVPEDERSIRATRLKRWTLSMGRRERERLKSLQNTPSPVEPSRPRRDMDEIACERGVELLQERGGMYYFKIRICISLTCLLRSSWKQTSNSSSFEHTCTDTPARCR